jgi:transcriptional regulator with XRE-family HTH domain
MIGSELGAFLRSLEDRRKKLKMPLDVLAERSGLSRATICRMLSGAQPSTSIHNLAALADALGVPVQFHATKRRFAVEFRPTDVKAFVEKQAHCQAKRLVGMVQGAMGLEAQAIDAASASRLVDQTCRKLVNGPWKKLWYD